MLLNSPSSSKLWNLPLFRPLITPFYGCGLHITEKFLWAENWVWGWMSYHIRQIYISSFVSNTRPYHYSLCLACPMSTGVGIASTETSQTTSKSVEIPTWNKSGDYGQTRKVPTQTKLSTYLPECIIRNHLNAIWLYLQTHTSKDSTKQTNETLKADLVQDNAVTWSPRERTKTITWSTNYCFLLVSCVLFSNTTAPTQYGI